MAVSERSHTSYHPFGGSTSRSVSAANLDLENCSGTKEASLSAPRPVRAPFDSHEGHPVVVACVTNLRVVAGGWTHRERIHNQECRSALMGLRGACRLKGKLWSHWETTCRTFWPGRTRNCAWNALCRRASAFLLAAEVSLRRHVASEHNAIGGTSLCQSQMASLADHCSATNSHSSQSTTLADADLRVCGLLWDPLRNLRHSSASILATVMVPRSLCDQQASRAHRALAAHRSSLESLRRRVSSLASSFATTCNRLVHFSVSVQNGTHPLGLARVKSEGGVDTCCQRGPDALRGPFTSVSGHGASHPRRSLKRQFAVGDASRFRGL